MGIHVVLYQPEIPSNTGNISRTCAATNSTLHLIRPLGFSTDDKMLKRAGLDYWQHVDIRYHDSLEEVCSNFPDGRFFYVENFGDIPHTQFDYSDTSQDFLFVFGRETDGLPDEVIENNRDRCLRLPMSDVMRSLNLSNTAAIMLYEALRQQGFPDLS
ncbi:tRNA (uridine(34)/cytosine(34)/5-carboxymethylaminomethyluridine(34)-2'-O)-methyltransferase TrmL [Tuberibacillus sp. Marseille-P3662]|uniref:tRNA (uridine(34)/cytosine(34)/5- carboxymethylaminomethyluridine(34)-2'-O)- methyltransferase TrmL n=1 Tax=Tuberibacillus sp. Marseille-P3662 TaxID=1965358 RepID=UPI000A1CC266|nr:tRNA (uridine(34)/cytosine(34)/5-carboxymethylaminomethyluridine(34)-2'-O)-methyltransferase TrmL [Tuberibacillus sp. Marseille-P3662]